MMRHFIGCALAALGLFAAPVDAQDPAPAPVVVELFTSQGCSSCPPADALLHELARRDDVIALSLHVDYWDYIGWKDSFAQPAFTTRQKAYARAGNRRSVYTPQIIIGGRQAFVGHDAMKIVMTIQEHTAAPRLAVVTIVARNADDTAVRVRLEPRAASVPRSSVQLVRFIPEARVEIRRGENAGQTLRYANVVREWTTLSAWDGAATEIDLELPGTEQAVLIVQADDQRDIVAAARLK